MARLVIRALLLAALAGCSAASVAPPLGVRDRAATPPRTGVVIPMYVYPGTYWNQAIAAKNAHPAVPMLLIANVNNGPGGATDPVYVSYIAKARAAGIVVLGYVYTQYGKRAQSTVDAAMVKWYSVYHADGIFLDQMASNDPTYYRTVTHYAHAHSLPFVMGNPGVDAPANSGPMRSTTTSARSIRRCRFCASPPTSPPVSRAGAISPARCPSRRRRSARTRRTSATSTQPTVKNPNATAGSPPTSPSSSRFSIRCSPCVIPSAVEGRI